MTSPKPALKPQLSETVTESMVLDCLMIGEPRLSLRDFVMNMASMHQTLQFAQGGPSEHCDSPADLRLQQHRTGCCLNILMTGGGWLSLLGLRCLVSQPLVPVDKRSAWGFWDPSWFQIPCRQMALFRDR